MNAWMLRLGVWVAGWLLAGTVVAQPLNANAGNNATICANGQVTLNGTANGGQGPYDYSWSPGTGLSDPQDNNPVCTVNSTTTYTLTVTDNNGNTDTDQVTVNVNPAPDADLVVQSPAAETVFNGLSTFSLCDPALNWNFVVDDQSIGAAGSTLSINWGDGSPLYTPAGPGWSTSHDYAQGLWTITYTITPPNGCVDTEQFQVFLGTNPGGGISTDPNTNICTGGSLPFYLNNVSSNTPGTTYIIDFGDGQTVTLNHPPPPVINHQYDVSSCPGGSFTVYFTAINPCDQTNGQISPVRVSQTPVVDFSMSPNDTVCVNTTVTFSDASQGFQAPTCTDPKNIWSISPATYSITSGTLGNVNGQPGNPGLWTTGSNSLGVTFNQPGTYTITDVTGNVCGFDTLSRTICVEDHQTPAFAAIPDLCAGDQWTVDNTTVPQNTCSIRYEWSASVVPGQCDASPGPVTFSPNYTAFEPTLTFPDPGTYTVYLEAINSCNDPAVSDVVVVGAPPLVNLYPVGQICEGENVDPTALVTPCGSPVQSILWDLPGGVPNSGNVLDIPPVTYPNDGPWDIEILVTTACGSAMDDALVTVYDFPVGVTATASADTICAGDPLSLFASAFPNTTYVWSGPGVNGSTQQNPTIASVTTTGNVTFTVTPTANVICEGAPSSVTVYVQPADILSIAPSDGTPCIGDSVLLVASGSGSGYNWTDLNGNALGTNDSLWVVATSSNTYTVNGGGTGCPGNASQALNVVTPTPLNLPNILNVCDQAVAEPIAFNPAGGVWSGADLVNVNAATGVVTPIPGQTGVDTLTYTYTNPNGCVSSDITVVTITNVPPADAGTDDTVCVGSPTIVLDGSPDPGTWTQNGNVVATFTPTVAGVFNFVYSTGSGSCADTDGLQITVVDTPNVQVNDFSICTNAGLLELTGATPAGGVWTSDPIGAIIGGGPYFYDPTIPANSLIYSVDLNGCTGIAVADIDVTPPPIANAGPDTILCDQAIPYPLPFDDPGGQYLNPPAFVSGNPPVFTPVPDSLGSWTLDYVLTLAGCSDTTQVTITVDALSVFADAGADSDICLNAGPAVLVPISTNGAWSDTTYLQVDGTFDPLVAGVGTHPVECCVGVGTCRHCDVRQVTVIAPPVVDAQPAVGGWCDYEPVQDLMEAPAGGTWSGSTGIVDASLGLFDPGAAAIGLNTLVYTYTDPGTLCTNTDTALITVSQQPVAQANVPPIACQNNGSYQVDGVQTGVITEWTWDFGDGTGTFIGQSVQHAYADTGTFTVTLIVGTGTCTDTTTALVDVWPAPVVEFTASTLEGCGPLAVDLTNLSTGPQVTWAWDFGNGTGSDQYVAPSQTYAAGILADTTYTITLNGTNQCGTAQYAVGIVVHPTPTALFGPDLNTGCSPWPVTFSNVTVGQADQFTYIWGDGTPDLVTSDTLVTHTYYTDSLIQNITVTMIAVNACGSDTASWPITVQPNTITAFFNTDTTLGCAPLTVNFTQLSIGVDNWYWNFGDGNFSVAYSPTHTYTQGGTFIATLYGDNGCSYDTVEVYITVQESPDVDFSFAPDPVCGNAPIQFTNLTPFVAATDWSFGDGDTSDLSDPVHVYNAPGTYPVTLTVVSSQNDCPAAHTEFVTVSPVPLAQASPLDTAFCAPAAFSFTSATTGANLSYTWSFDGTVFGIGAAPPPFTVDDAGQHTVQLIVADLITGCADTISGTLSANPTPTASFTLQPVDPCGDPAVVLTTNTSTPGTFPQWWVDGSLVSTAPDLQHSLVGDGIHTVQLVVVLPPFACTDTADAEFELYLLPVAAFSADTSCTGQSIPVTDLSANALQTWWYFNGAFVSTDVNTAAMIPETIGLDTIALTVMGEGGCMDSVVRVVNTYPTPPASFLPELVGDCQTIILRPDMEIPYADYLWSVGGIPFSYDIPTYYFYDPATSAAIPFSLTVTSLDGCVHTVPFLQEVPSCVHVPNAFTPDGDGLNEEFYPVIVPADRFGDLYIFDRWGNVIQEYHAPPYRWDGEVNGEPVPPGVYPWKLKLKDQVEALYGHVTVVR